MWFALKGTVHLKIQNTLSPLMRCEINVYLGVIPQMSFLEHEVETPLVLRKVSKKHNGSVCSAGGERRVCM